MSLAWQPSLLGAADVPAVDRTFASVSRLQLSETAWVDLVPDWLTGADALFESLLHGLPWAGRSRRMYDRVVEEPRLTARWPDGEGDAEEPWDLPPVLADALSALREHYGRPLSTVGFNLYRDGRDSVAWHGDRIPKDVPDPVVVLLSLGGTRPFLLRPKGGGKSIRLEPRPGSLLVTGGSCQRTWDHSVPKVKSAPPRISVAFRHGKDDADPNYG